MFSSTVTYNLYYFPYKLYKSHYKHQYFIHVYKILYCDLSFRTFDQIRYFPPNDILSYINSHLLYHLYSLEFSPIILFDMIQFSFSFTLPIESKFSNNDYTLYLIPLLFDSSLFDSLLIFLNSSSSFSIS